MKALLLFLALSVSAAASPCLFYLEKSASLGCSQSGYLQNFGFRYCAKFLEEQSEYTPAGQNFLSENRNCLIKSLERVSGLNCANVRVIAEATHVQCYLQTGFCRLPEEDKLRVFLTAWQQIFDPGFSATMQQVRSACDRD